MNQINYTSLVQVSDARIKGNVTEITGSLEKIDRLRPVTFTFTTDYKTQYDLAETQEIGFIAQEVEAVIPEIVLTGVETVGANTYEDFHSIETTKLIPLLVEAVQELKAENETLRERVEALENP